MYNLKNIVKFEIIRTLKKPTFWISALLMPVLLVGVIALSGINGMNAGLAAENDSDMSELKIGILDKSGIVKAQDIETTETRIFENREDGIEAVRSGEINIFYYVPADLVEDSIDIFYQTSRQSLFENFSSGVTSLLMSGASMGISDNQLAILSGQLKFDTVSFVDGNEENVLGKMIIPIITLAVFYILICVFGNQMMTSTTEEKENRVTEMILTTTSAKSLIVGKIISLITLGFLQVLILAIPIIVGYLNSDRLELGGMNVREMIASIIVFDPATIAVSLVLLVFGYVLFTGILVTIGSMMPTAKEANSFFGVAIMMMFLPMFFISSFMSSTPDTITKILSFFPLSAPIALMTRNAFGTLTVGDGIIGISIIVVSSVIAIRIGIRAFQYGALEFGSRVRLRSVLQKDWK